MSIDDQSAYTQPASTLLIADTPLQVLPHLATMVGLNEAIVLQQLHYWLHPRRGMGQVRDGRRWVYNTYADWQDQFPFWSLRTIQGIILRLQEEGLILATDEYNGDTRDRTKWYTIVYEHSTLAASMPSGVPGGAAEVPPPPPALQVAGRQVPAEVSTTDDDFEQVFWKAYPRKTDKPAARRAWRKAAAKASLADIMAGLSRHLTCEQWQTPKYIPHPATWLNGERWNDTPEQAAGIASDDRNEMLERVRALRRQRQGDPIIDVDPEGWKYE